MISDIEARKSELVDEIDSNVAKKISSAVKKLESNFNNKLEILD
tara:strand:+ start:382 stop:513 length:132 start_codon:yes stop_codon:yes gene_type:complete